jgi:hypothetical protein
VSTKDARVHPRHSAEIDGKLRLGSLLLPVRTRNVSRGGLCFVIDRELPRGESVDLEIALLLDASTISESLRLRARIVWCTAIAKGQWQIGASFVAMTADSRRYLDVFVKYVQASAEPEET